jgi:hypothetical protein
MTQSLRHKAAAPDAPKAKVAVVRKLSVNGFVSPAPSGSARVAAVGAPGRYRYARRNEPPRLRLALARGQVRKIRVMKTADGESPLVHGAQPILGCDVWKHS